MKAHRRKGRTQKTARAVKAPRNSRVLFAGFSPLVDLPENPSGDRPANVDLDEFSYERVRH